MKVQSFQKTAFYANVYIDISFEFAGDSKDEFKQSFDLSPEMTYSSNNSPCSGSADFLWLIKDVKVCSL